MRPRFLAATGLAITLLAASIGTAAPFVSAHDGGHDKFTFDDMQEAPWAAPYVAQLAFQGVVNGVGNGNFDPNGRVTRIEAIAMIVRALANGQTGSSVTLNFADDSQIPAWATASVQAAVQMGMLANSGTLDPNGWATRTQVATWIINAMGLQGKAQIASTQTLQSFSDSQDIPEGDQGDMALAVDLGLMNGEGHGKLAPEGTITRAQVAALIARAEAQYGAPNTSTQQSLITGTLTSVSTTPTTGGTEATQGSITFSSAQGAPQTVGVATNAAVFSGESAVPLASLTAGGQIILGIDAAGNAVFVDEVPAKTGGEVSGVTEVEGTVTAVSSTSITVAVHGGDKGGGDHPPLAMRHDGGNQGQAPGQPQTFTLTPQTVVTFHGQAVALSEVSVGSRVHLRVDSQGNVLAITIQEMTESVTGTIASIGEESMVLTDASGNLVLVKKVDKATITDAQGNPVDVSQLTLGETVTVTGTYGEEGLKAQTITIGSTSAQTSQATPGTFVLPVWSASTSNAQNFNADLQRLYTPTNQTIASGPWAGQAGWGVLSISGSSLTFTESAITQAVLTNNADWQSPTASPWSVPVVFEAPASGATATSVTVVPPSGVTTGYPTTLSNDTNYSTEELAWLPNNMAPGTYTYTVQWSSGQSNTYTVVVQP